MKTKLDIQSVAVKQLESAIWMYAYDCDEVSVHTIAGAAFELFTKRLKQETIMKDIKEGLQMLAFRTLFLRGISRTISLSMASIVVSR